MIILDDDIRGRVGREPSMVKLKLMAALRKSPIPNPQIPLPLLPLRHFERHFHTLYAEQSSNFETRVSSFSPILDLGFSSELFGSFSFSFSFFLFFLFLFSSLPRPLHTLRYYPIYYPPLLVSSSNIITFNAALHGSEP